LYLVNTSVKDAERRDLPAILGMGRDDPQKKTDDRDKISTAIFPQ
jgi:hypothetical protein